MSLKKKIGAFCIALALVAAGGYGFYKTSMPPAPLTSSPSAQANTILQQRDVLKNAFKRMESLGYNAEDIHYNSGQQSDIIGALGILDSPLMPPAAALNVPTAQWAIGGGQLTGAFNEDAADIAFYLSGITAEACQALNTPAAKDTTTPPVLVDASLPQWQALQANTLPFFQNTGRESGCIAIGTAEYIYYVVVAAR
jgi:hypothetical protein